MKKISLLGETGVKGRNWFWGCSCYCNGYIGANIAQLRKIKGMTQDDIARAVGISSQSVSKYQSEAGAKD